MDMNDLKSLNKRLDSTDIAIIETLVEDARTPVAKLARRIGMSSPSAAERLRRLEDAGVISGYKAQIDPEALGYGVTVYIRVRPMAGQLPRVAELLPSIKEIVMCDRITGEDCFIAKAHLPNIIDLETLIDKLMPYAQTNTSVVQSSPVALRLPPLPE